MRALPRRWPSFGYKSINALEQTANERPSRMQRPDVITLNTRDSHPIVRIASALWCLGLRSHRGSGPTITVDDGFRQGMTRKPIA
jgi:hypothetical protein